jgi:hypothetical protein
MASNLIEQKLQKNQFLSAIAQNLKAESHKSRCSLH